MLDPHDHRRAAQAARDTWQQMIKTGGRRLWSDWLVIGAGLMALRAEAMAVAGTERPRGKTYNAAMSALLAKHRLNTISETPRRCLLKIMERLPDIERWRARQDDPDGLNHPIHVWRRFTASSGKTRPKSKPSTTDQLRIELAAAHARLDELGEELQGARKMLRIADEIGVQLIERAADILAGTGLVSDQLGIFRRAVERRRQPTQGR